MLFLSFNLSSLWSRAVDQRLIRHPKAPIRFVFRNWPALFGPGHWFCPPGRCCRPNGQIPANRTALHPMVNARRARWLCSFFFVASVRFLLAAFAPKACTRLANQTVCPSLLGPTVPLSVCLLTRCLSLHCLQGGMTACAY